MKSRHMVRFGSTLTALTTCLVGAGSTAEAQSAERSTDIRAVTAAAAYPLGKLVNVRSAGTKCGTSPIAKASGSGGIRLTISETKSVSTTLSADIGVSYKVISAGVGWNVQKSRSITISGSREVSRGKHGTLTAYAKYSGKKFDIFDNLTQKIVERNKTAYKPIGVCFTYKER
ncbi:hypothetical protein ABZ490_33025 [Streptomyces sp. NPDC005811]|uniref:hypothetical protein n=1 Tax=Streptomyces sp. NPDC005811 TaxID=3154565 RepID=UPI0033F20DA0